MQPILYAVCVGIVLAVCVLGVLHPRYEDNLIQRIGLSVGALGSMAELWFFVFERFVPDAADLLFAGGVALFCIGTVIKKWRGPKLRRRSTDLKS